MNKLYVIKIGGSVINDEDLLSDFLDQFVRIDVPKILVHGGGSKATAVAESLGVKVQMTDGRRITDAEMLEVVTMVYGGLINKNLVARLQSRGCNAVGLTGADADIIHAHRRENAEIDFGFVGDIDSIQANTLQGFLESGMTPVLAALTHDGHGTLLNTNADTIAATVAGAFVAHYDVELLSCFEHNGVLESLDAPNSVLASLTRERYSELKDTGAIASGMLPKIDTGFWALLSGVRAVKICHAGSVFSVIQNTPDVQFTTLQLKEEIA